MKREAPVVDFPMSLDPQAQSIADIVKRSSGFVSSLVDIFLGGSAAAVHAAGSPGATIDSSVVSIDFEDCLIDDIRVVVYGSHDTAFAAQVTIFDVTDGIELTRVALPPTPSLVAGEWTRITPSAGDHRIELRVIGDGADAQTIFSAHFQGRTLTLQR